MLVRKTREPVLVSTRFRFNDLAAAYNDVKLNCIVSCVYVATYNDLSINLVSPISDVWIVWSKLICKQFTGHTLSSHNQCIIFNREQWVSNMKTIADCGRWAVQLKCTTNGCTWCSHCANIFFIVVNRCQNSNSRWYWTAVWARFLQRKWCIWTGNRGCATLLRWCWVNHCYCCLVDFNVIKISRAWGRSRWEPWITI